MRTDTKPVSILSVSLACLGAVLARGIAVTLCLCILVLCLAEASHANPSQTPAIAETDRITSLNEIRQGTLLFREGRDLFRAPIMKTDVVLTVTGMIARVSVRQHFHNNSKDWQEGIYVFPLPYDAAVDHMWLEIGERIIEGRIREREQARKTYEKARQAGKKTALVEQERPNVFTTSVANIAPDETVIVDIQYQQTVPYENGSFKLRFPLVVAPRYIPDNHTITGFSGRGWASNTDQVADAARITPPVQHPDEGTINPVNLHMDLNAGFEIATVKSSYHAITVDEISKSRYRIELADGDVPADRDLEICWRAVAGQEPRAALFTESRGRDNYALLMLLPSARFNEKVLNRDLVFVIDTSGSMAGTSILQAKAALQLALTSLKPGDRFNLIQFNSTTQQLFQSPQAVTQRTLQQARLYIDKLVAQGGTEMADAMRAALADSEHTSAVRQVVFLTDGSIGNEDELFGIIKTRLKHSRLFTVGIGSAPNLHFMQRAARFGRGTHTTIGKLDEVQAKMEALFHKLESPVLTDIAINWPDSQTVEFWPEKIPDLYQDQPLLLTFRATQLPQSIIMSGRTSAAEWQQQLQLAGGEKNPGVNVLWARNKIAALMDKRHGNPKADHLRQEIISTALQHHLVSKFTSLVAVDITPARTQDTILKSQALPVNLPDGWVYEKVFGALPATATRSPLDFMIGFLLLALTLVTGFLRHAAFRT